MSTVATKKDFPLGDESARLLPDDSIALRSVIIPRASMNQDNDPSSPSGDLPGNNRNNDPLPNQHSWDPCRKFLQYFNEKDPNEFAGVLKNGGPDEATFVSWKEQRLMAAEEINLHPDATAGLHANTVCRFLHSQEVEEVYLGDEKIAEVCSLNSENPEYFVFDRRVNATAYYEFVRYAENVANMTSTFRESESIEDNSYLVVPQSIREEAAKLIGDAIENTILRGIALSRLKDNSGILTFDSGYAFQVRTIELKNMAPLARQDGLSLEDLLNPSVILPHSITTVHTDPNVTKVFVGSTPIAVMRIESQADALYIKPNERTEVKITNAQFDKFLSELQHRVDAALRDG